MRLLLRRLSPMLLLLTASLSHAATPYSVEISAGYGKSEVSQDNSTSEDANLTQIRLSYFLQASSTDAVPPAEAAYLAKSDSISLSHQSNDSDGFDLTTTSLSSRYVTETDAIYKLGYERTESGDLTGDSFTVGFGGHISDGHSYTIDLLYTEEPDIISLAYSNRLVQGNDGQRWSTLEFSAGIFDVGENNNLSIGLTGDSYLSLNHSIGAGISYVDLELGSTLALNLSTRYFFSDRLFAEGRIFYTDIDVDNNEGDGNAYILNIGSRF